MPPLAFAEGGGRGHTFFKGGGGVKYPAPISIYCILFSFFLYT